MIAHANRLLTPALLGHAATILPTPIPPSSLHIPVVQAPLLRLPVGVISRVCRLASPRRAARITAIGVAPVAAAMNVKQGSACPTDDLVQLHPLRVRWIIGPSGRRTLCSTPFHSFQGGARCARPPPPPMPSRRSTLPCSADPGQFSYVEQAILGRCIQTPYIAPPAGGGTAGLRPREIQGNRFLLAESAGSGGLRPPQARAPIPGKAG